MTRPLQATNLNMQAFAEAGVPLNGSTPLQILKRLAQEIKGLQPDLLINWQAKPELRVGGAGEMAIWLHLTANTTLPLTCQRCMGLVQITLQTDQWYRFVASEDVAMAEDDAAEEDLLVLGPQFDLIEVLEDELLMALPLVPMHDVCPEVPVFRAGVLDVPENPADNPNPFAALAQLKKK